MMFSKVKATAYYGAAQHPGARWKEKIFGHQGKYISAKWRDSQTLEVTHDPDIEFIKKDETFFFCGDQGIVVYLLKGRPVE